MPFYENVFIARQDISAPQVESLTDDFSKIIEDQGGKIAKREYWGLRTLAYKIKKNRKGHYVLLNLDAPATAVHEMERQMRLNEDVLRYLTLRVEALEEGPSVMMQSRGGRDDRSRRDGPYGGRGRGGADARGEKPVRPEAAGKGGDGDGKAADTKRDKDPAARKTAKTGDDDGAAAAKGAEKAAAKSPDGKSPAGKSPDGKSPDGAKGDRE